MRVILTLTLLLTMAFAGCLSNLDDGTGNTHPGARAFAPTYGNVQPETVTGLEFVAQLEDSEGQPFPTGAGIWVYGDFVFGSARSERFFVADVSDPTHPQLIYQAPPEDNEDGIESTVYARDADLIEHDDGRRTLALATQWHGVHFWDVTNPYKPELLRVVDEKIGANHNVAVIPGTAFVFNSQSGGEGNTNEIIDARDPANARVVGQYGTHGCHDITFFGSAGSDKFRAYCAGIDRTEVWNLDNFDGDAAPGGKGIELISTVEFGPNQPVIANPAYNGYPLRTLHHLAMVNADASVLIIGDEQNGGGTPGGCAAYEENTGMASPTGALWFYDLADETAPELMSWLSPPTVAPSSEAPTPNPDDAQAKVEEIVEDQDPAEALDLAKPYTANVPNCTAHFGSLVPGEEKMVMSWYSAGVLLIDFTDANNPRILDQYQPEGTNPWDARIHSGYVFTGDIARGMDVLQLI